MTRIYIEASAIIDARPEEVYPILADYHEGHPAILPKPYFVDLIVEEGGQGAGTVIRVLMKVLGVERTYRMEVSEPEPGRVLVETDRDAGVTTTFTVEPLDDGKQARVTIATDMTASPGLMGLIEKWLNPPISRLIYKKELQQLADYVRSRTGPNDGAG